MSGSFGITNKQLLPKVFLPAGPSATKHGPNSRLAHVGMKNLHKLLKGEHILGLTNVHFEKDRICSACQAGKQVGAHHPHKNIMTTDMPPKLLHMDLFGLIAYISIGGSKYYLVIVDDYSCFTWVFFCSIPKIQILKFSQTRSKFKMNLKISFQNVCLRVDINK